MTGLVADIGTTTITVKLIDDNGNVRAEYTDVNPQRRYGADVLTRIKAANNGKAELLQRLVTDKLADMIKRVMADAETDCTDYAPDRFIIAGNTVMIHLLLGYSCDKLGTYPFSPATLSYPGTVPEAVQKVIGNQCRVYIFPGIAAFIGGDIVAGIYALANDTYNSDCSNINTIKKPVLLIDLGTNGELALMYNGKIYTASTAAGPAFEGGGIAWGTGCIEGAICEAFIYGGKAHVRTEGDKSPVGICGTGVIDLVAGLLENAIIDKTGLMHEDYFEHGFDVAMTSDGERIRLYQDDIRNIQLAKAAVRAGIELLLRKCGLHYEDISEIYLAGSFGEHLKPENIVKIGLIPKEMSTSVRTAGNTAIAGCVKLLKDDLYEEHIEKLLQKTVNISLAEEEEFNDLLIQYISF